MCLEKITKKYPKKDKTEGFGYKVILHNRARNRFMFLFYYDNFKTHEYNKWVKRRIHPICSGSNILPNTFFEYDSGFHIFKTRKAARIYKDEYISARVVKVQYKGIVCEGIQSFDSHKLECLVVKQIKVIKK